MSTIYESEAFIQTQCGSMHPGGLRLTDRAARLAGICAGMRAADIGCGTGTTAAILSEKYKLNVIGLDISDKLIHIGLKNNPDLNLIRWDGKTLPFPDGSLDAVFFECTLSVIGTTSSILAQCAKALKLSGVVIISDVYAKRRAETGNPSLFTSGELTAALTATGFDVIISEDHTPALRTYAAELWESNAVVTGAASDNTVVDNEGTLGVGCLFGMPCNLNGVRLSEVGYILIIAKKTGD